MTSTYSKVTVLNCSCSYCLSASVKFDRYEWWMNSSQGYYHFLTNCRVSVSPDFILAIGAVTWDYDTSDMTKKHVVSIQKMSILSSMSSFLIVHLCFCSCVVTFLLFHPHGCVQTSLDQQLLMSEQNGKIRKSKEEKMRWASKETKLHLKKMSVTLLCQSHPDF